MVFTLSTDSNLKIEPELIFFFWIILNSNQNVANSTSFRYFSVSDSTKNLKKIPPWINFEL